MTFAPDLAPELERVNRLYSALSHVNRAIVRITHRDELFQEVCKALVEQAGFRMAWIGWHNTSTHQLVTVASFGNRDTESWGRAVYADDRPEGRGPSGRAFRAGKSVVSNDLLADPSLEPWRASFEQRGFRATAACPIRRDGTSVGVLTVYAGAAGYFQERELALLEEVTIDIAFALDTMARDAERVRSTEIAQREQAFSAAILESMPGVVYLYDEQRRFLRWNDNFLRVSGYTAEELQTMHPLDFFTGAERERVAERIAQVFSEGEGLVEASFLTKDGRTIPHLFTGRRLAFDGYHALVGMGIDVSQRRRAELALQQSEARFHSTLDSMAEGCRLIDFDWRYLYVNEAAAQHDRRPTHELLGRTMPEVWPGIESTPVFAMMQQSLQQRVVLHSEVEFTFADGSTGWFDVRVQPVPEGIFVLSIDILDRKAAEFALRDAKDTLAATVEERTRELRTALVRAEAADRLKSSFLATMSHELRTPLNSIIGFTGIVLQGLAGPLTSEQSVQLGMVRGSARHLLELINDVLDISKIEAGQMAVQFAPFDVVASLARIIASVRPLADKKLLALVMDGSAESIGLVSDRRRVEQIVLNLLNNAIKFTDSGEVRLTFGVTGDRFVAQVIDTGIGIKPMELPTLFQPFHQLDSGLARQHEGTGLGLAICRRLATLLHGEISVTSEPGRGSTFSLSLPLAPGTLPA